MTSIISIGNKLDNRLQNLIYLTRAEHNKIHKIGKTLSKEHKAKLSNSKKGKNLSAEHKAKLSAIANKKQVYCLELDRIFDGVRIAGKELSLYHGSISSCCKGKLKTTGGYHFEYYTGVQK